MRLVYQCAGEIQSRDKIEKPIGERIPHRLLQTQVDSFIFCEIGRGLC